MLSSLRSTAFRASQACLQQQTRHFKCSVLGAAGGIGQPLALLMSINPRVTALTCYDVAPITPGVACDLSHINSDSSCTGYTGDDLNKALEGCDVVVIPAGVPRKPCQQHGPDCSRGAQTEGSIQPKKAVRCYHIG